MEYSIPILYIANIHISVEKLFSIKNPPLHPLHAQFHMQMNKIPWDESSPSFIFVPIY